MSTKAVRTGFFLGYKRGFEELLTESKTHCSTVTAATDV